MKDHICEESPHVDGLCIECWKARAEKAEQYGRIKDVQIERLLAARDAEKILREKAEAALAHLQSNAQAGFEKFTKAQADVAKAEQNRDEKWKTGIDELLGVKLNWHNVHEKCADSALKEYVDGLKDQVSSLGKMVEQMREILDSVEHSVFCISYLASDAQERCPRCRWEKMKKEMK